MHRVIRTEKANHPVATLCRVLGVSRAGFYAAERRAPSPRAQADAELLEATRDIHAGSRTTYVAYDLRLPARARDARPPGPSGT